MKKVFLAVLFAVLFFSIFVTALFFVVRHVFVIRPNLDVESAAKQAVVLLNKAGGINEVCREASIIFGRFGISELQFFSDTDLRDFPAMVALGKVDGIWPEEPPYVPAYIKIRVGNHMDGYIISIINTNTTIKYQMSKGKIALNPCIYVNR
jgi:hypothetical protein